MTIDELMDKLISVFPEGMISTNNDGQLIVYTNLRLVDGQVVRFED